MAIRQVNGKNAYVIEVAQPTAKTSRGEGYAQLITNLRWKMWEEAQKSELMALEFEKMAYQQQLRLFQTQQKAVQDEIDATKRAITALNRAELSRDQQLENNLTSAQNSERRRRASAEESRLRQQSSQEFAGQETTTTRTGGGSGATSTEDILADLSSDSNDSFQRVQEEAARAGETETDPDLRINTSVARAVQQGNFQVGAGGGVSAGENRRFKAAIVADQIKIARDAALADGRDAAAAEEAALNAFPADYQADYSSIAQPTSEPDGTGGDGTSVRGERDPKPIDAPVPTAGTGKAAAVDYSKERERLQAELAELQGQLGQMELPAIPNVDLLERTRGKFQSAYGEGGFGLAPRPTRALPRFDEPAATRAAQDIAAFGADKAVADFRAANPDVELNPQQIASLRRQGVLGMLNEMGGREVAEKDFLDFRTTEPATSPRQEQPARELPPLPDEEEPPSQPPVEEPLRLRRDVPISTGQQPMGVGQLPVSGELEQQLMDEDQRRMQMGQPPQQFGFIPQQQESKEQTALEFLREMEALGYGDAAMERLRNEFLLRQQTPQQFYGDRIATETYQPPPTLAQRILPSPVDRRTPEGRLMEEQGVGLPTQPTEILNRQGEVVRELPSPAARFEERQERQQNKVLERRNAYKLRMIERATTLANQPKKFERIAKTNLPPEERAKKVADYVLVVDNLYVANQREGGDPILPSYEEINRVYADDPRTREQATSYLLAKQILDVKVENPE